MRKTKRRMETLSMYDHTGISRHLEKMAAKGWMLDRIANYGWIYKRIEPKKLHFAVSYYPKASEYDPEYPEEQQTLHDFCAHTGWKLVCTSAQMQVFCNENENPIPIETDPVLEVETIDGAMEKSFLRAHFILLGLSVVMGFFFLLGVFGNIIYTLADPIKVFSGLCWLLVFILAVTELTTYYRWLKKAKIAAEQGQFLDTPNTRLIQRVCLWVLGLAGVYLFANLAFTSDKMMLFIMGGMMVCMGLVFYGADGIKRLFKRWKVSKNVNRVGSFLLTWLLAVVVQFAVMFGAVYLNTLKAFDDRDDFMQVEHPLRVEDLLDVDHQYVTEGSPKESILLAHRHVRQRPWFDVEDWSAIPRMEYDLVKVKWPFLYDDCKAQMVKDATQANMLLSEMAYEDRDRLEEVDPAPWGAVEAYHVIDVMDDDDYDRYLLCYEDVLAEIGFSWEITEEQKQIVGEKIG